MKTIFFSILLSVATMLSAQNTFELPLWPAGAPNSNGLTGTEEDLEGGRVANVIKPSITVYKADKPNGVAIIMCPGGGYARLAMNHEGHDMAPWLNAQGITYIVLKYRMPNGHYEVPLSDAEQAIRLVRQHAKELVVSSLGVLYADDAEADQTTLAQRLPITPLVAYGYMVFILLYFPCVATLAAIRQEAGGWKWATFAAAYTTVLAWIMSFAVYQIGGLFV